MESRSFIKTAANLIKKIEEYNNTLGSSDELRNRREVLQKEINQAFTGLQNPTLPSAYRLRDASLRNGFFVDPKTQHRLSQYEHINN
jgi:hypothetical protein